MAAGGSSNALKLGLNTSTAGNFSGTANLALASHNPDLADVALSTSPISVQAQVLNFAIAAMAKASGAGTFSGGGTAYTLDFGNVLEGSASLDSILEVMNTALGPSDLLGGSFSVVGGSGFGLNGFNPFNGIAAGGTLSGFDVTFDPFAAGSYSLTLDFSPYGYNSSGYNAPLADEF